MMSRANSRNALNIIERALAEGPSATATITTIDTNFPIGTRINYFRRMQHEESLKNEMEGLDHF